MKYRTFVVAALAAVLFVAACKKEPPPPPAPTGPTPEELAEQRRLDSIRAAEEAARRAAEEAERRAAEERARLVAEARNTLTERVHFDYDMADIRPDAAEILRAKADILRASPAVRIRVEGHCDERGSNEYNQALGNRRAQAVVDFFASYGLDPSRFDLVSFGEERPLVHASNEEAWAQNRRAEFIITAGQNDINPGRAP